MFGKSYARESSKIITRPTWQCPCVSAIPKAMCRTTSMALEGRCVSFRNPSRVQDKGAAGINKRQLCLPPKGITDMPSGQINDFCKKKKMKCSCFGQTWIFLSHLSQSSCMRNIPLTDCEFYGNLWQHRELCSPPAALDTLTFLKYYRQNKRLSSVMSKLINISHKKMIRAYIIHAREANTIM